MPPIDSLVWPLVIVGKGSAAAYYVCTVDLNLYPHVLAIGDEDPWAGPRGHHGNESDPTRGLNHPLHMIEHFKRTVPGFSEKMVDRIEWARMNKEVLDECNVQVHNAKVKMVKESDFPTTLPGGGLDPNGYKIDLDDGKTVYALKVVMAAGAGAHRVPPELKDWAPKFPKQIINIDEFAKLGAKDLQRGITHVIVWGPNAAIDAVQKALHYQCKVSWLVDKPIDKLPILSTQPTVRSAVDKDPSWIYEYASVPQVAGNNSGRIRVKVPLKTGSKFLDGDYYVYGLGQGGEPLKAIDGGIMSKMEPIYDKNQYLGGGAGTILGYQAEGTGLKKGFEVVGAMTAQVGREVGKSLPALKSQLKDMRSIDWLYKAITTAGFPTGLVPFLLKDIEFLTSQPRDPMAKQLRTEAKFVADKYTSNKALPAALDGLVSLILACHAAKNYAMLINQATSHLPKGTVGDGGQLSTIKSAMAAKHDTVPKYQPGQKFTTPGPTPKSAQKTQPWVKVQSSSGDVDFNADNATVLQIGLCQLYPLISDKDLNNWIDELMKERRRSSVGFNSVDVTRFHKQLTQLNNNVVSQLRAN